MLPLVRLAAGRPRVFPSHPRAEGYFPSSGAEEARTRLWRCLERGEGPALLIGTPGVGKTSLLAVLREQLEERFHVASLTSAQLCTRRALLQSILFSLGQPYRHREEGELRISLVDYLTRDPESKNGTVLLVDEAQALPQRLLEELRALGNLAPEGEASVRLLLAGGPSLEELFAAPENEAFNQRVSTRCYLSPMSHADTVQYVRAHIAAAGGDAEKLIAGDALDAVYHATDGIARLVNQVCDRALVLAADAGYATLERAAIETAWADLQQLPTPWNLPPQRAEFVDGDDGESVGVVEFGPLSEDTTPSRQSIRVADLDSDLDGDEMHFDLESHDDQPRDETMLDDDDLELLPLEETAAAKPTAKIKGEREAESLQEPPAKVAEKLPREAIRQLPARDPFADDFEEEEVVIESFATVQSIVAPSAPRVCNQSDGGTTSRMLAELQSLEIAPTSAPGTEGPYSDSFNSELFDAIELTDELDGNFAVEKSLPLSPSQPKDFAVVTDAFDDDHAAERRCGTSSGCLHPCQVDNWSDELKQEVADESDSTPVQFAGSSPEKSQVDDGDLDLLVVDDDDVPLGVSSVEKRDYRQLFTTLQRP